MQYNKIPIVMDQFNSFEIPPQKKPYILRKLDPFQPSLLQGTLVYLYLLQITVMTKL